MSGIWEVAEREHPTPQAQRGPDVSPDLQRVVVVDFDIRFGSLVLLMIKIALASIPAALVLMFLGFMFSMYFGWMFG